MCAHAVRVAISKIDGVSAVTVSLNEGMTTVQFAPSNRVRAEQIRDVVRASGFAPKEADVRMAGALSLRGDTLTFAVPGAEETYVLQDVPGEESLLGALRQLGPNTRLEVTGRLPASAGRPGTAPRVLMVRAFQELP
ncbi:MAG: heavy-metal-associated domain-containing protein [Gemmatimonadota bacterium]